MTNDGELANKLAHPSYRGAENIYRRSNRIGEREQTLQRLRRGITLEDGPVRPTSVKIVSSARSSTLIKITLQEGRNRIVRRTMEAVGHPVRRLSRIGIGPVRLGNLKVGEYRELTREELGGLLDLTGG